MGLKTMRYRAQLLGARLEVADQPAGVTITCRVPCEKRCQQAAPGRMPDSSLPTPAPARP